MDFIVDPTLSYTTTFIYSTSVTPRILGKIFQSKLLVWRLYLDFSVGDLVVPILQCLILNCLFFWQSKKKAGLSWNLLSTIQMAFKLCSSRWGKFSRHRLSIIYSFASIMCRVVHIHVSFILFSKQVGLEGLSFECPCMLLKELR